MANQRNPESGYALLMVFAMAAVVGIMLYSEAPRVAFEAQRDKEQLLIDRGSEYSRAIQLFVRQFKRFPTSIDELENTNNQRTLRSRYVDPMTGKADWRIIHAGPGGTLLDSITTKKKDDANPQQNFITYLGPTGGGNVPSGEQGINLGLRKRPSDQNGAAGELDNNVSSLNPAANSPVSGYNGPVMVLPDGRIVPAVITGVPGSSSQAGTGGAVGFTGSGLPTGVAIQQQNTPPLPPIVGQPPASAADLINQILTTPRPGGQFGIQPGNQPNAQQGFQIGASTSQSAAPQQQVIGGGIAGVASKREQEGIKTWNQRTAYNEWEFIYDITKDPLRRGAVGASGPQGAQPVNIPVGRGGPGR